MKISELIDNLKNIKDCCGDLEVEIFSSPFRDGHYTSLDEDLFTVDKCNNKLQLC